MGRRFKQLTRTDRIKIEALRKAGQKPNQIASYMGVNRSTIYRELKRGTYEHLNSDYTTELRYSPDKAEERYRENLKSKGPGLKIGNDQALADYIEKKILEDDYSPDAVIGELNATNGWEKFNTRICTTTLYSYIDKGIFLTLTNKNLTVKGKRKRTYRKVKKQQSRDSAGTSIEKRPKEVDTREEFGHWEMDSVMGQQGISKESLLTLTERMTRGEKVFKLHGHTAALVVEKLDELERKYGKFFSKIFKTITVDNGTEFSSCEAMEKSALFDALRTKIYYCHPYSSYERGSNENCNRMVRRKVPKGKNIDDYTDKDIEDIEDWINSYPRRILGYQNAGDLLDREIAKILAEEAD